MNGEPRAARSWLPWLCAAAAFVVTLQTADEVLDVPVGATPLVAAAAAVPLGLITTLPALGWLLSAGAALLVSRVYDVVDGDPWPWPTVHGMVLLALLFATGLQPRPWSRSPAGDGDGTKQRSPDDGGAEQRLPGDDGAGRRSRVAGVLGDLAVPVVATVATAFLFAVSVPDDLRAGWAVGAALIGAAGIVAGTVIRRVPAMRAFQPILTLPDGSPASPGRSAVPPADLPRLLRAGLRQAVLDWRPPPAGEPSGIAPWVRRYVPWLAAFVVFWAATATIEASVRIHPLLVPVAGAAIALPVGLIDRYPLVGWRVATLLGIVLPLLGPPSEGEYDGAWPVIFQWSWLVALYFVAVRYARWTTVCVWAITVTAMLTGTGDNAGTAVTMIVAGTAVTVIGDLVRARRRTSQDLERQTELSELEKARRTVLEERSRIARDLHDVVAHHMSMVVVQAETAPYRIDGLSDPARAEFASISGSARQALDEIRGLLGVLRGTDETVALAPQPGLAELGDLVDGARRSGVAAELTTAGEPAAEVPATVGLSAYRIVQESLANAVRHAPGSAVTVRVSYAARSVELRISNTAPAVAAAHPATQASGHGLPGMRERAAVVGGTFTAGPTADGGFAVTAVLPYRPAAPGEDDDRRRDGSGEGPGLRDGGQVATGTDEAAGLGDTGPWAAGAAERHDDGRSGGGQVATGTDGSAGLGDDGPWAAGSTEQHDDDGRSGGQVATGTDEAAGRGDGGQRAAGSAERHDDDGRSGGGQVATGTDESAGRGDSGQRAAGSAERRDDGGRGAGTTDDEGAG
ncbi:sensor histidine kinase [Jiangella alba]|uniref:sensor histidine kinase n=1 Tax=Jiangella alba TaxID=561176 RepID=UPI00083EC0D8|nr:histidine kinase [Jiangella alba]